MHPTAIAMRARARTRAAGRVWAAAVVSGSRTQAPRGVVAFGGGQGVRPTRRPPSLCVRPPTVAGALRVAAHGAGARSVRALWADDGLHGVAAPAV